MAKQKTSVLYVECTPRQKARYVQTANRRGLKVADWVRAVLDQVAEFDSEHDSKPSPDPRE
jgi:hypothetical protein